MRVCPTCQSDRLVHNGSATGKPTKPWKPCGDQCTRTLRGTPLKTQINAGRLYLSGLSMHRSAFLLRVSAQSILNGIRACAKAHAQKPAPMGCILIVALDAMGHSLKTKRCKRWMWQALDPETSPRLAWEGGRRAKVTVQKRVDRRTQGDVKRYNTAHWAPSAALIPQGKRVQSRATTPTLECNHCRQRYWCGRCKRKSILVSKSKAMVDLTSALLAKFWLNGNQDALLSRNHARMPHCLRWGGMASLLGGLGDRFPQQNRWLP